ncbi:MAG: AI-2E family transporter [Pyrinomonadaceae bacterium]
MPVKMPQSNFEQSEIQDVGPDIRLSHRDFIQKIGIVVLFVLGLMLLWQGAEVFLLIFAGFLLAVFLRGLSEFGNKHTPLSETQALTAVLLSIAGFTVIGIWLLTDSMQNQFDELSNQLPGAFEQARQKIAQYPLGRRIIEQIPSPQQIVTGPSSNVWGRVTGIFSTTFDVVVNVLIILVTAIYLAFNPKSYKEGVIKLVPKVREKRAREVLNTVEFTLRRYLLGTFASVTINGSITFLGLWFLGVPFAIPLAVITSIFNIVPNFGPLAASVPAILIAFSLSPTKALYVALLYLAIQNIDGFLTTPLIQQRAVAIPPVLIIAGQLLLAVIFGFLGLLLAVPIVAVVFVLVKMIYVEDILGKRVEVKGEPEAKKEVVSEVSRNE